MPTNDTKQSNSYCPKHNTQHKAIFPYTFTPHLTLPTQIFLQIVDEKKSILERKYFSSLCKIFSLVQIIYFPKHGIYFPKHGK